jgi:RHS repeat-associated protein
MSDIDAVGIETVYEYDSLNRIKKQTKKGIAAGGGFPAQPDIVTIFEYDAEGRQKKDTLGEGNGSLIGSKAYDRAGRLMSETDAAGLSTTYSYANGGRTQTITRPGGATGISDKYIDGQPKSVTGTAVVPRYFDYGVNVDGTRYTQEFTGSAGLSSPRWTKTTNDWVDRTVAVEKPSFSGANLIQTSIYNSLDQLQKQTITANTTKLIADKLYEYDQLGQQIRSGSDIDASGTLTLISTDHLIETDTLYEKVGNDWFRVTSTRTYLTNSNDSPVIQTERERLNNFPLNGTEQTNSEVTIIDFSGNSTKTTTTIDRPTKKQISITDTPDSTISAVTITVNGLLQSSNPTTQQSSTTYSYDSLGRPITVTDPGIGTASRTYNSSGQLEFVTEGAGNTTYEYYDTKHMNAGRLKAQTNAAGKKIYFNYNNRGELIQTWGDATYPLEYIYDGYGQRTELHTFRGGQNWAASVWPTSTTGVADVTKWIFQESTGLLTQKQDAALKGPTYTYDELGRTKTRVWARGITCTYGYDANTGELRTVTYSDATPSVTLTYDRGGRQTNVTDAAGTHTLTFNVSGELQTEQIAGGILDGAGITIGYDSFLRRNSLQTTRGANTLSSQTYGYDPSSRLLTVTSGTQTATYGYDANSGLLNTTSFTSGTTIALTYEGSGRLHTITTTPTADTPQAYTYTSNNLNQRTRVTREDGSYWSYVYNDRGELFTGRKYWADNSIVWGAQTEYNFDNIGNSKSAKNGGNQLGTLRQSNYYANSLNQYSQRTVPGAVDVSGTANSAATVTVNNQPTARKGDYFYRELGVDNTTGSAYPQINVIGARNNFGAGGEDAITEKGGRVFLPPAAEAFTYDDDGNLTADARWNYSWDGANRLVGMEAIVGVAGEAKSKLEFAYDYAGRRIRKNVYSWNVSTSSYELQSSTKFVYENWNLQAELDETFAVKRSYVWGNDVSGSLARAGGIGGLLLTIASGIEYQVGYDGNGNVGCLVKASIGTIAANYEYDPLGNILKAVGEYATQNPFRFSTKYSDIETGLVYYGARYSNPKTGKWLSRDAIGEEGSPNLSLYNDNDPVNLVDPLGFQQNPYNDPWLGRIGEAFKFKHYLKSSPNWDFASAAMYHSLHTITLKICNMDAREALNKAYSDLRNFEHFDPNLATVTVNGDRGHFNLRWTEPFAKAGSATPFVGNSIDVLFHRRDATRELFAVTTGDHPLVGMRKWWVVDLSSKGSKSVVYMAIFTEAYEQTNGPVVNRIGRWWPLDGGHSKQNRMWTRYLNNIAEWWKQNKGATLENDPTPMVEATNLTVNPFRKELPLSLQKSDYYYDYNPF